jgi:hypothetical protein
MGRDCDAVDLPLRSPHHDPGRTIGTAASHQPVENVTNPVVSKSDDDGGLCGG